MLAGCGASFSIGASQLTVRYLMANTLHGQQTPKVKRMAANTAH